MACDAPLSIRYTTPLRKPEGGYIYYFPADCGKCLKCLTKRKAQWSYRMMEEKRQSFSSYFVTLTYDDKHLPRTDYGCSINKNDHFEFIKNLKELEKPKKLALRSYISKEEYDRQTYGIPETAKFKYYGVSEYGDLKGRSHWHYILFNIRDIANITLAWGKGKVDVDPDVNVNNIDYVLKYMIKDHSNIDYENRDKEKSFMSKGLGLSVADSNFQNYIGQTQNNQVLNQRGTKIPLPRYYRKKLLSEEQRMAKAQYIAEQVEQQKQAQEILCQLHGLQPGLTERNQKEARLVLLQKRQKRNYE